MNLLTIESTLDGLEEMRLEVLDSIAFSPDDSQQKQDSLAQIDATLKEYLQKEVQKADSVARWLRSEEHRTNCLDKEIELLKHERDRREARREYVKAYVLAILQQQGKKKIEGETYTLKRQGNGGVQPVEIVQPELIPDALQNVSVKMSLATWREILEGLESYNVVVESCKPEPNKEAIREQLLKREPCPLCAPLVRDGSHVNPDCVRCHGDGTVPAGVPGARLLERGEHLRVS